MFRCIFCCDKYDEARRTVEHVFPEAIGGTLTLRDMCKPCNDFLGHSADVALTDHFLVKQDRQRFKLEGKGKSPNPFARGQLREPEGTTNVRWEETGYVYRLPSKRVVDGHDELWLDPRDAEKAEQIQYRSQSRVAAGEEPLRVRIISDRARGVLDFPIDTSMTSAARGVIKVAYETAALLLGDRYLNSESAMRARDYLRSPVAESSVPRVPGQLIDGGRGTALGGDRESILIAGVVPHGRNALSYVRIFSRCELAIFLGERVSDSVGADGVAYLIDVLTSAPPVRTTFRALGWFG
jgi:HNH endonuclease